MDIFTKKDIEELIKPQDGLCCSIYMPTHRIGYDVKHDPILLKNLLNTAEKKFSEIGVKKQEAEAILEPARKLIEDTKFWQYQSDGLALFASAKDFFYYRIPSKFKELVVVTTRFHIKPMIPIFSNDQSFNILGLSQNMIRFFQCTMNSIREVQLEGVPTSIKEALGYEEYERYLQFHTQTGGNKGNRHAVFHGQGDNSREVNEDILRYFRLVDDGLKKYTESEKTPMIIAAVDHLIPMYREVSDRNSIMETGIKGNPEEKKAEELHNDALKIVQPILEEKYEKDISRFRQLIGKGSEEASDDIKKIIFSSDQGRVDTLFVPVGIQLWGLVDIDSKKVHIHKEFIPGDEDLLDHSAAKTIINGGSVYALAPEKMPDNLSLAAIFRY